MTLEKIYWGTEKPPIDAILPYHLKDYKSADAELNALFDELKELGVPQDIIFKIESKYNERISVQLSQHWVEGFKAGAKFQIEILSD